MHYIVYNIEENSLHHVAMVAKFLVENKSKHLLNPIEKIYIFF